MGKGKAIYTLSSEGYITTWLVLGPFLNRPIRKDAPRHTEDSCPGYYRDFLSEIGGERGVMPQVGDKVKTPDNRQLTWQLYLSHNHYIDFKRIFYPYEQVVAYAFCYIIAEDNLHILFRAGSDDGIKVFLDDRVIWDHHTARGCNKNEDIFSAWLHQGQHRILVKVCQDTGEWGFCLGITSREANLLPQNWPVPSKIKVFVPGRVNKVKDIKTVLDQIYPVKRQITRGDKFSVGVHCGVPIGTDRCSYWLEIEDSIGKTVFSKKGTFLLQEVNQTFRDIWDPSEVSDGEYRVTIVVSTPIAKDRKIKKIFSVKVLNKFFDLLPRRLKDISEKISILTEKGRKEKNTLFKLRVLTLRQWYKRITELIEKDRATVLQNINHLKLSIAQVEQSSKFLLEGELPRGEDIISSLLRVTSDLEVESVWEVGTAHTERIMMDWGVSLCIYYAGIPLCWAAISETSEVMNLLRLKEETLNILTRRKMNIIQEKMGSISYYIVRYKNQCRFLLGFERRGTSLLLYRVMGISETACRLLLRRILDATPFTRRDLIKIRQSISFEKGSSAFEEIIPEHEILIGDTHVHSRCSDGIMRPIDVVKTCIRNFMDFVALSDHDTIEGSLEAIEEIKRNKLKFIVIPSEEISAAYAHILAYGVERTISPKENPNELLEDIIKAGGTAFIAHPGNPIEVRFLLPRGLATSWSIGQLDSWKESNYYGFEAPFEIHRYHQWLKDFKEVPIIICGSDAHVPTDFTWPLKTIVFTQDKSWRGILSAIRSGKCIAYIGEDIWGPQRLVEGFRRILAEGNQLEEHHNKRLQERVESWEKTENNIFH
ncbi:hypothetical protein J7K43_01005 [Candidatus Calescamantes bacterium]|nr:hypothetical protein [Candidatus Calescamantes bacterium]